MTALAPHLDPAQLDRALDLATGIDDEWLRALALEELAPYLDVAQLDRALRATLVLPHQPRVCTYTIFQRMGTLAAQLSPGDIVDRIRRWYRTLPPRDHVIDVIGAAAQAIVCAGGHEALASQVKVITQGQVSVNG